MVIIGYLAAIVMGAVLGLIGGGGSILTVPILVYILGVSAEDATAYSLFVVGIAAIFGSYQYTRKKMVNFKVGLIFAVPAFVGVFSTRAFIVPNIPKELFRDTFIAMSKDTFILLFFAAIMLLASISMIRGRKEREVDKDKKMNYPLISAEGLIVGGITGFVGAGGGFLIVPALVILAGLDMKIAVGTSLVIIAIKSLIGFLGDLQAARLIDWNMLLIFSALAILGTFIGSYLSKHVSSKKLKPAFGWFVLVMGSYMFIKEAFF